MQIAENEIGFFDSHVLPQKIIQNQKSNVD